MEYLLVVLALVFALAGMAGAVLPVIPGTPISFVALLMLLFCDGNEIGTAQLIIAGVAAAVVMVLDYVAPIWFTKKFGGSKYGMWGATAGLVLGFFFGPVGVIAGPFLGAYVGELLTDTEPSKAFRVACMTFVAFMLTTGLKLIYGVYVFVRVLLESWDIICK